MKKTKRTTEENKPVSVLSIGWHDRWGKGGIHDMRKMIKMDGWTMRGVDGRGKQTKDKQGEYKADDKEHDDDFKRHPSNPNGGFNPPLPHTPLWKCFNYPGITLPYSFSYRWHPFRGSNICLPQRNEDLAENAPSNARPCSHKAVFINNLAYIGISC